MGKTNKNWICTNVGIAAEHNNQICELQTERRKKIYIFYANGTYNTYQYNMFLLYVTMNLFASIYLIALSCMHAFDQSIDPSVVCCHIVIGRFSIFFLQLFLLLFDFHWRPRANVIALAMYSVLCCWCSVARCTYVLFFFVCACSVDLLLRIFNGKTY